MLGDDPEERVAVHVVPVQQMRCLHICRYFYAEVDALLGKVRSVTPLEQGAEDKARELSRILARADPAAAAAAAALKAKPSYQLESETTLLVPMVCAQCFWYYLPCFSVLVSVMWCGNRKTTPTLCTLATLQASLECFLKAARATCVTVCRTLSSPCHTPQTRTRR